MGQGIGAAIPLILSPYQNEKTLGVPYFDADFIKSYERSELDTGHIVYSIKRDVLLGNYNDFLVEFYDLIGEKLEFETDFKPDVVPVVDTFEDFLEAFERDRRNATVPVVGEGGLSFSMLGGSCDVYWRFYSGSWKAYLETYCTLVHFERILAKAMSNPLGKLVKFGMSG